VILAVLPVLLSAIQRRLVMMAMVSISAWDFQVHARLRRSLNAAQTQQGGR
jgi:hypothetical protein